MKKLSKLTTEKKQSGALNLNNEDYNKNTRTRSVDVILVPFLLGLNFETLCATWYHFYNLKSVNKTHGGMKL